ncbi:GNAT family N-acetyltransferase [Lentzea sp. BCCO 10_0798]|uniref:GNAT family N-acetyltransferase n=1 Tax=Lentzea kristufekii TaxID=3095430 RepID=A0ABU4TJ52_9PSEU|nr:GNAT family N-acetyltransferase [Lentzea sp. BCCO 10_0798]MDX8048225.1 GNAT family N-acetyltransferase [Lentzea sp. BCCO 10_0798]
MELVWRPLTTADIPAVAALYNAAEAADDTGELLSEEDFAQSFGDTDLPGGSLAVLADGRLAAYGLVALRDNPVGTHRVRLDGMVHPEHRRAGIGLQLLPRLAALARDLHVARHPALPLAVCTMVESRSEGHVALVEKLGFRADRHFYELEVALGESLAQVPIPSGYEIVPFSAARDEEVRLVCNAAFAQHWGSVERSPEEWAASFTDSVRFVPESSFLALSKDNAVAGFVLARHYPVVEEMTGVRELWIGDIGTLEEHRGRGVASALLSWTLAQARAKGYHRAGLSVDSANSTRALGVYERAGFEVARTWIDYGRPEEL